MSIRTRVERLERRAVQRNRVVLFVGPGQTEAEVRAKEAARLGIEPGHLPIHCMFVMRLPK